MMDYLGYEINFGTIEKPNNIRVYHTPEQVDQGTMDGTTDIQTALGFHGTPGWDPSPVDVAIRDEFDTVLLYFEQFEIYIQKELCSPDDIEPYINYHVKLFNGQVPHSQGYHEALFTYIVLYEFALAQNSCHDLSRPRQFPKR